ncbi:MAG: hypothetical protein HKL87_04755 [Acidimicrobiaceae bacterium]|nr:hypothetical protein [Acidimicrobiaceae bacterium]
MSARRLGWILGGLFYLALWGLALTANHSWIGPLATPLVLGLLVAGGVWIQRFVGISPRHPKFEGRSRHDREDPSA